MTHSIRHSTLTAEDVGTIVRWMVADAAGLAALTPTSEDLGRIAWQLDTDQVFLLASLVPKWIDLSGIGAGVAVWGAIVGTLANQADLQTALDANVLVAGTRAQSAMLLLERADHVNTPTATFGEIWIDNTDGQGVQKLMFTDDAGDDRELMTLAVGSGTTSTRIPFMSDTGVAVLKTDGNFSYIQATDTLLIEGGGANAAIGETSAAPTTTAGRGYVWVKNDAPNVLRFTDDASVEHRISPATGKTTAPGTGDDGASGYPVGSIWVDETNDDAYISLDATTSTAVWKKITP